jgi:hypothetical protein
MKVVIILLFIALSSFGTLAQMPAPATENNTKTALEYSIHLLTLVNHSVDFNGPYQAITGEKYKTDDGWDYIAIKNLTPPRGIKQYLFRDPKKWPNYIAELSDNDACMAMIEAITNILPNEEPKGDFSHQTDDSKKGEGKMIYYIVMNGKK